MCVHPWCFMRAGGMAFPSPAHPINFHQGLSIWIMDILDNHLPIDDLVLCIEQAANKHLSGSLVDHYMLLMKYSTGFCMLHMLETPPTGSLGLNVRFKTLNGAGVGMSGT